MHWEHCRTLMPGDKLGINVTWELFKIKFEQFCFNPLNPRSDLHETSPYIHTLSSKRANENTQTYQVEVVILIQYQILLTNFPGIEKKLEGRVNNQILGVKGLSDHSIQVEDNTNGLLWLSRGWPWPLNRSRN